MPQVMETATLRSGATTEKIPLMPQAQGAKGPASRFSRSRPVGKKAPSSRPMGATSADTIRTRAAKGRPIHRGSRDRARACSPTTTAASVSVRTRTLPRARRTAAENSDPRPVVRSRAARTTESA